MYLSWVVLALAATVHCAPRKEPSALDVITRPSTESRLGSEEDWNTKTDHAWDPAEEWTQMSEETSTQLPEESPETSILDIISGISRFKRSPYGCGGWGKPLPIPPPCRSSR